MKTKATWLLALLFLVGAALGQPASAQVYNLYQGNSFSYNGLNFTVSSCTFEDNPPAHVGSQTCNAGNYATYLPAGTEFYIAADPSAPATSVIIEALNGGLNGTPTPIFSYTCGAGTGGCDNSNAYDLGLTLTVTPASGTLSSAVQTMNATSDPGDPTGDVTITESINPASNPTQYPSLCDLGSTLGSGPQSCTFAPQASLSVAKDFQLGVGGVTNGTTLALNSVVETFAHAPEPSSIAMLIPALLVLGWACRRKALN